MLRATIYTEEMVFSFYDQKLKKKSENNHWIQTEPPFQATASSSN